MASRAINLLSSSLAELSSALESLNEPKFRAKQIYEWVRQKGVTDPAKMTNLPLHLRDKVLLSGLMHDTKILRVLGSSILAFSHPVHARYVS